VALKTLHPEVAADPERKRRLLLEAQAASALNDPHIVALYDVGSADGIDFLVMEYVPGQTLDKLIPRGGLEIGKQTATPYAIAGALARAHKAGIVHRDLKPGNIMITEEGGEGARLRSGQAHEAPQASAAGGRGAWYRWPG
jgi:serine/threonine protein kinase